LVIVIVIVAFCPRAFLKRRLRSSEPFLTLNCFALNGQPPPLHATFTVAPSGRLRSASFFTRVFPRLTAHFATTFAAIAACAVG
jgi:hypothetical protein